MKLFKNVLCFVDVFLEGGGIFYFLNFDLMTRQDDTPFEPSQFLCGI